MLDQALAGYKTDAFCPKAAIAEAFGKAAQHYDQHAQFQRDVGTLLLAMLPQTLEGLKVLDIGCGTGYFSQQLAERGARVTAADLSPAMLKEARNRCGHCIQDYRQADAESLPFPDQTFDLVFSSLALQWCHDLAVPLRELRRVTRSGGRILFSILMDGSLEELKQAWAKIDTHQHVNQFLSRKEINIALAQSSSDKHHLDLRAIRVWYSSAFELMRDLKGIGANYVNGRSHGLTGRRALLNVEHEYQRFKNNMGLLPATYQVCLGAIEL
ncbi:malonyl-[acyl-carrier protein] O-methyltransferase BioC [Vibrio sp. HA2012]|uniref:malonyl-ACP O-methyltransferase BioC n=1 Tax=Vibrio sp. HA2012 TaxID=1971595 RepID=UPI000C2C97CE|nr:malonyl-ACP O-methyltransferase BioC [Vibrio sp. HA2012]PJC87650.1 malonyl-[acyl-carrier protein] O-methyltransferase BioC [Vibrio sp. HA2012]